MELNSPIFALDIGTRSVIGVLIQPVDGKFEIKAIKMVEHQGRSMLDGQIHDVLAVSDTIIEVKQQLESTLETPLRQVAVAAAGRSLKTSRVKIETSIESQPFLRKDDIRTLELSVVQEAQKQLIKNSKDEDVTNYHCVGYSVVNYFLDDQVIGSLIDQRGKKASVEIIATFLPRVVVDSLVSSLDRADLEMTALTLEPIAAIHVLIPPSMRKLNIAFVDIGAGTSDIAITAEGTITAYGMVPVAGDEITEAISQFYLLDFHIAEEIKRKVSINEEVDFTDILGMTYTLPSHVLVGQIDKDIDNLANHISQKILELNSKPPQAVILVGGGSQTPKLTEKIATKLNLPAQRVAIRGADAIQHKISWPGEIVKGPELVTPIGIGISSRENPIQYLSFYVNDEIIRLFEMKSLTVGDALIAANIPMKKLIGKPGLAMTVTINGEVKIIPGKHGTLPKTLINDNQATLDSEIFNGDRINITAGMDGENAELSFEDALKKYSSINPYKIIINGEAFEHQPLIEINGIDADITTSIKDRDSINFYHIKTIEEALVLSGFSTIPYTEKKISFTLNNEIKEIKYMPKQIYRNGQQASLMDLIYDGDVIAFDKDEKPYPVIKSLLQEENTSNWQIKVTFNGRPVIIEPSSFQILMNNKKVSTDTAIVANSKIAIVLGDNEKLAFSDVFRYIDFDRTKPVGTKSYIILVNGEDGDFHTPIKHGDNLELSWK